MSDSALENLIFALSLIKDHIIQHVENLLELLEPILDEDDQKKFPECITYIQNIRQSGLLLLEETTRLLEQEIDLDDIDQLSNYLSKIRHDLRNHINSMQGYAEISLEDFQAAGEKTLVKKIKDIISRIQKILLFIDEINVTKHLSISHKSPSSDTLPSPSSDTLPSPSSDTLPLPDQEEFLFIGREQKVEEFLHFKEHIPILVVDDIEENCRVLSLYLNHIGYKNIDTAYNGQQALKIINERDISIVLLDIDMPEMTGIDVLQNIKSHERHRDIMVLMISAADTMENTIKCIKLGAEDFLPKPFNRDLLRVRLGACAEKKWFKNKEAQYHHELEIEKQRYEKLLNIILPPSIVTELTSSNKVKTRYYKNVAVLFADVANFTKYCDSHSLSDVEKNLQKFSELCEELAIKYNLQKIKTIGDAFLATAGMLTNNQNPVLDCVNCAAELLAGTVLHLPAKWQLRIGIDFGSVVGGIIGHRQFLFDIWGDTVNTSSRIQTVAEPDSILLTKQAFKQVEDICDAESLGAVLLKGKTPMELFKYKGRK